MKHLAAPFLADLHNIAHIFLRHHDIRPLPSAPRCGRSPSQIRQVGRILHHLHCCRPFMHNLVNNARRGSDHCQIKFPFQTFHDDLHMKQPQESAAESEAQCCRGFRLKVECRIIDLQLFQGVLDILVLLALCRINPAVIPWAVLFYSPAAALR